MGTATWMSPAGVMKLGRTTRVPRLPLSSRVSNTTSVLMSSARPLSVINCPGLAEACAALTALPVAAVAVTVLSPIT